MPHLYLSCIGNRQRLQRRVYRQRIGEIPPVSDLPQLQPFDVCNQKLQADVAPPDWRNPEPAGRYNLIVVGAGPAGLVAAAGAAGLGARVALIERSLMGGDCLNSGCVPSKALIAAARRAAAVRSAGQFGVTVPDGVSVDFAAVMQRMRRLRSEMSRHDSVARFTKMGVDVFLGNGCFVAPGVVNVDGQQLSFRNAVVCTGARAAELSIPGLEDVGALTNETLFSLTELPQRLVVIGGGPIGCEMAQSFALFGSQVTLLEKSDRILPREDPAASAIIQRAMEEDGVQFLFNATVQHCKRSGAETAVGFIRNGVLEQLVTDKVLVGVGRVPNVDGLGLEQVGVKFDSHTGIAVNDQLRTTNPRIFAAGDVCSQYKFTHAADFMARIVLQNALFKRRAKASALTIPWCSYTSPEVAHVGPTFRDLSANASQLDSFTVSLADVDRAILEGVAQDGFVRVHVKKGTDEIVSATAVAENAGDMLSELTLAMTINRSVPRWKKFLRLAKPVGLSAIANNIHPYPTQSEAVRKLGDQYNRTRLTPLVKQLFGKWLEWMR